MRAKFAFVRTAERLRLLDSLSRSTRGSMPESLLEKRIGMADDLRKIYVALNDKFIIRATNSIKELWRLVETDDLAGAIAECRYLWLKAEPPSATNVGMAAKELHEAARSKATPDVLVAKILEIQVAVDAFVEGVKHGTKKRDTEENYFSDVGHAAVVTNKAQIDLLSKQMSSWNKAVYTDRVLNKFLEEELVCKLELQRVQARNAETHRQHQMVSARNRERCDSIDTPYVRKKESIRIALNELSFATTDATPRFRDVDEQQKALEDYSLKQRQLAPHATNFARPVSARSIALSVRANLPPIESIMNPPGRVPELVRHIDRQEVSERERAGGERRAEGEGDRSAAHPEIGCSSGLPSRVLPCSPATPLPPHTVVCVAIVPVLATCARPLCRSCCWRPVLLTWSGARVEARLLSQRQSSMRSRTLRVTSPSRRSFASSASPTASGSSTRSPPASARRKSSPLTSSPKRSSRASV